MQSEKWTDDFLISYCEAHCETPRALFSSEHVNRMLELAGFRERVQPDKFFGLHEEMKDLVKIARQRKNNGLLILRTQQAANDPNFQS